MSDTRVRDHLANERTFLAWVRTSVALMGFGVVIAKLRFLFVSGMPGMSAVSPHAGARSTLLGLLFSIVGLLTLLFAAVHYQRTRRMIDNDSYRPLGGILIAYTVLLCLLGAASIGYLLVLR